MAITVINTYGQFGNEMISAFALSVNIIILFGIPLVLDGIIYRKCNGGNAFTSILLIPFMASFLEDLEMRLTNIPCAFGYTFHSLKGVSQFASLFGITGISFLAYMFLAMLAGYFCDRKKYKKYLYIISSLIFLVVMFGEFKIRLGKKADYCVPVALAFGGYEGDYLAYGCEGDYDKALEKLKTYVDKAAKCNAELLVLSEEAFEINDADEASFIEEASKLAADNHMNILVPMQIYDMDKSDGGLYRNNITFVDSTGKICGTYDKTKLVPVVESSECVKGDDDIIETTVTYADGKKLNIACIICFDSDNENYMSRIDSDTDVLIVPAWDWKRITPRHTRIVTYRAIENDIALVKCTYDGSSVITDWTGNNTFATDTAFTGFDDVLTGYIPVRSNHKISALYHYIANYMMWFYLLGAVTCIVVGLVKKKCKE